ncbi:uncharacterized protein C8Q71DRAFT_722513 [Rhodofomes roseus]|uniref:MYND-type domain-containing protein n=1 Tax=Rhodofomes roseus TaxID=34475 RepID=A0ABQ8KK39_9APHY|nr:uncharacterized protein C8Q71DRAFT_722513 [Rhodofomes roseus]KAH9838290.1 hypothetical protein C8Q71DRAFT_722513 [Rhodofomes roseus]
MSSESSRRPQQALLMDDLRAYPGATVPGLLPMSEDASPIEQRWAILSAMPKTHLPVCLPQALLDDLRLRIDPDFYSERSLVFGRDALHARTFPMRHLILRHYVIQAGDAYAMVDESWANHNDNDSWSLPKKISPESKSTYLHFAVRLVDVPFVYECIRLGADVNYVDAEGRTPLFCAMEELFGFIFETAHIQLLGGTRDNEFDASAYARLRHMVKILVEQHAIMHIVPTDSDTLPFLGDLYEICGTGLLAMMAWLSLDLELLELFALHGFPLSPLLGFTYLLDQWDTGKVDPEKASLCKELVVRLASRDESELLPRPPRKCPCWSGKPLHECHGSGDHPYPPTFACICRSAKTYANCCRTRGFAFVEQWNNELGRMTVLQLCEAEAEGQAPTYVSFRSHTPGVPSGLIWPDTGKKKSWELLIMAIEYNDTQSEEKADPAFRAAALISEYLPLPGVDWGSKVWGKEVASFWNRTVDDYIALGTDTRSKSNIGRAAKLDPFFLPLWKRCEATGCTKIDRPGLTMKRCRGCQRIFYCGPMCQKAHWKEHKPACQRGDHPLQLLRSQTIYKTIIKEVIEPAEERLLHDAIDSENSKSDGADSESSNLKSDDADSDN